VEKISEKILFKGRWLSLKENTFRNSRGEEVSWEGVVRNKKEGSVIIIPILMPSNRIVLIRQYRLPLEDYVISFPAGMVAEGDTGHALVELKQETGYTGKIVDQSPPLQVHSGLIDEKTQIVVAHIDENDPQNKNPLQALEPTEEIEVLLVPKEEIRSFLLKKAEKGSRIAAGVWSALGFQSNLE
jgi:ADP-ribose pyrophosphatase